MAGLPETLGAADMARLLGLTSRRLQQLTAQGVAKKDGRGKYPAVTNVQAYVQWRIESEIERRGSGAETSNRREEIRLLREERKLAEEEHRLIDIEEHDAVLDEVCGILKSGLSGLSARVTRDLDLRDKIEAEIDGVLKQAAQCCQKRSEELRTSGQTSVPVDEDDT